MSNEFQSRNPQDSGRDEPRRASSLDLLSEMATRLSAVEASQAEIHAKIDAATKAGTLDPELLAKTSHVMQKYFPHDNPETEAPVPARPMFDAFTGERLQ